jgi:hypothetical protein
LIGSAPVVLAWTLALLLAQPAPDGARGPTESPEPAPIPDAESDRVLSFFGLLELEKDPEVSDEEKVRQWKAFLERTERQRTYARRAVERWTFAERRRLLERAVRRDPGDAPPEDKHRLWREVAEAFGEDTREGRRARDRAGHWKRRATQRRVDAAMEIEREGRPKVDRIRAWKAVVEWAPSSKSGKAARARIRTLQARLVEEAQSLDGFARIDDATRLRAWRQVLAGDPTPDQARRARRRIRELTSAESNPKSDGP